MAMIAKKVTVQVEHDRARHGCRSRFVASAGHLRATTKWFGGEFNNEQARNHWLRQPEAFSGDTALLRRLSA